MKKTIIILAVLLIGIFIALSLIDAKGPYVAERELWRLNKQYGEVSVDPQSVPDATFNKLIVGYQKFVRKFSDSSFAPLAHILIGKVYRLKGDNIKARKVFEEVVAQYKDEPEIAVQAVAEIGNSYAADDDLQKILETYKRILVEYPTTTLGLQTPLLISQFYTSRGELDLAQKAFSDAVIHYKKIANNHKDSQIEFDALRSVAICYIAQKRWEEAVNVMGNLLNRYPDLKYWTAERAEKIIKSINTISVTNLKSYDLPIKYYQQFIDNNPQHRFSSTLKRMIESFTSLKEKNIKLQTK